MQVARADADESIRSAYEAGDMTEATTAALRAYGPEVLGFLVAACRDENLADDAFSLFSERVWHGIARFQWKSSVRTWLYVLARHALADTRRDGARHRRRRASTGSAAVSQIAARIRTHTLSILRTENRTALSRLRDELIEEDRVILVLRVDRDLPWRDIARVLGAEGDEEVTREAARFRKRFQFVKDRLHALARQHGLQ
jgi:RNA polymerase sigma-70 factor (ECF subfamily)